jgi:protein involved in polysaccharide export with SLBB domain
VASKPYSKPALRQRLKNEIMAGGKGGKPGQWSARKAQLLAQRYEKAGGGYTGSKTKAQSNLKKWTNEKWRTKSGKPSTQGPKATGERYLPSKAIKSLSDAEYGATSNKKRAGTKAGKQFVPNTKKAREAGRRARGGK